MKSWKKVKLGTLLTESKILSEDPNPDKRIRVKLNVLGVEKRPLTKDKKGATKYYKRSAGQFIYGKQNLHKGAFGIIPEELNGFESSLDIPAFDVHESCYPEWIYYFFKKDEFYLKLENLAKGVGSKRIHPKKIFELDIHIPPKSVQKKIIDELIIIEKKNNSIINEINLQLSLLENLKNRVLDDAIFGNLTKKWRKLNSIVDSGELLLYKIKERQNLWIKKSKINGYKEALTIEKKLKKIENRKLEKPNIKLPANWAWSPIIEAVQIVVDCHNKTAPYISNGIPLVRTSNIKNGQLDLDNTKFISEKTYEIWSRRCPPLPGDILFTREAPVGEGAIIPKGVKLCMGQRMMLIRVYNDLILRDYLLLVITSPDFLKRISQYKKGNIVGHLRVGDVENFHIQIPPFEEQVQIVKKINNFFKIHKKTTEECHSNLENINKLFNNLLIKKLGKPPIIELKKTFFKKNKTSIKSKKISKYNTNTLNMDLVELLKVNKTLHAEDLWKMSKYPDDIDSFYSELKKQIEQEKTIREVTNEKGYLELV